MSPLGDRRLSSQQIGEYRHISLSDTTNGKKLYAVNKKTGPILNATCSQNMKNH